MNLNFWKKAFKVVVWIFTMALQIIWILFIRPNLTMIIAWSVAGLAFITAFILGTRATVKYFLNRRALKKQAEEDKNKVDYEMDLSMQELEKELNFPNE